VRAPLNAVVRPRESQLMAPLQYRPAVISDVAECIEVRGRTRENAVSASRLATLGVTAESWSSDIQAGWLPGQVCIDDGRIVGYCFGDRRSGEIVVLALLPTHEGRGIGKALLSQVVQELRSAGFSRLHLGCSRNPTHRSYGFYRHVGWRSTGTRDERGDEILELTI
jgi:GNAT superfamily N-acetyltransferase